MTTVALPSLSPEKIQFAWMVRLRWAAIGGQLLVFAAVELVGFRLPRLPLVAIVGFEAVTNAVGSWLASQRTPTEQALAALLALDVLLLTCLLYFTGGPLNPFTFLYMVHVALAASTLSPRWAWLLALFASAGFGGLFLVPPWNARAVPSAAHADHLSWHLYGMFVAFAVSALFVVYFVARVRQALAEREAELEHARDLAQRQARFASLATMTAGAAHELSTPLSTIAVAAKELERRAAGVAESWAEDVRLIREQVRRCQEILQQMAVEVGNGVGEATAEVAAKELVAAIGERAWGAVPVVVRFDPMGAPRRVRVPQRALGQVLQNLVKNAVQASPPGKPVEVELLERDGAVCIEVRDHGPGMPPEILARAGEPFFTTKAPGEGIGLGLFLARSVLAQSGGRLELESSPGKGTVARVVLPKSGEAAAAAHSPDNFPRLEKQRHEQGKLL